MTLELVLKNTYDRKVKLDKCSYLTLDLREVKSSSLLSKLPSTADEHENLECNNYIEISIWLLNSNLKNYELLPFSSHLYIYIYIIYYNVVSVLFWFWFFH